ncbi:MAG: hypothetical protein ACREQA_03155, partial [Candidatus Binatia bacterium]
YYAYVRSSVVDRDLHFENEYRHGDPAFIKMAFEDDGRLRPALATPGGYVRNQWAVGPSLLWTPFFLAAHGLVLILNGLGLNIPTDGYSAPYRWLCAFGTALYAFVGLLLAHHVAKRLTNSWIALLATAGIWFASSLPVYMYFLPFHVHALAAFLVSLFLWYWLRTRPMRSLKQWGLWGLVGGLMVEVYYLNVVFLLIPLTSILYPPSSVLKRLTQAVAFGVAALLGLMPNLVIKWIIHGSPWSTGYDDRFFWDSPRLWQVAFAPEHGMFLWTPVLLFSVAGLILLWRRDRSLASILMVTFVAFYYTVASYQNWHGQSAFGSRFFISFTPVFVLGLAVFLEESQTFLSRVTLEQAIRTRLFSIFYLRSSILYFTLVLLILWNIGFIFQWGTDLVPNRGPVDFAVVARQQMTVVPHGAPGFILRYMKTREQVIQEVEQEDLIESQDYRLRR